MRQRRIVPVHGDTASNRLRAARDRGRDVSICQTHPNCAVHLGTPRRRAVGFEWPDVDMHRREFTLRHTKNGETRTVPMTPDVYRVFTQLWQERRLDPPSVSVQGAAHKGRENRL